jgi:hypothetical protein
MFDTVFVKYALPLNKELKAIKDIKWEEEDFQTKDLENLLSTYEITKTGKLRYKEVVNEWVDDENTFLKGYMKEVSSKWIDTKHTGKVRFYHSFSTNKSNHNIFSDTLGDDADLEGFDWWVEFEAEFVKGKITEIKFVTANKEPAKFRILSNIEWAKNLKKEEAKLSRRIVRFLRKYNVYRQTIKGAVKLNGWFYNKTNNILFKL